MKMCKNKAGTSKEKGRWKIGQGFVVVVTHRGSVLGIQCRVLSAEFSKMDDAG